jgi:hypothetical protein
VEAELLFERKFEITTKAGLPVVIFMDLYKLPKGAKKDYPEGYKFSWIAFDSENEAKRVLFDCHTKKGPHLHLDGDKKVSPLFGKT